MKVKITNTTLFGGSFMNTSSCLLFYTDHYNTNAKVFHLEELKKTQITRHKRPTHTKNSNSPKHTKNVQFSATANTSHCCYVMITLHCHWLLVSLRIKCKIHCHCFIHYAKYFSAHLQPLLYTASETFHSSPQTCVFGLSGPKRKIKSARARRHLLCRTHYLFRLSLFLQPSQAEHPGGSPVDMQPSLPS